MQQKGSHTMNQVVLSIFLLSGLTHLGLGKELQDPTYSTVSGHNDGLNTEKVNIYESRYWTKSVEDDPGLKGENTPMDEVNPTKGVSLLESKDGQTDFTLLPKKTFAFKAQGSIDKSNYHEMTGQEPLRKRLSMDPFNMGKRLSMDPFNMGKRLSMDPFNLGKRLSMDPFNMGKRLSMDPFNLGKRLSMDPFNMGKRLSMDPFNLGKRLSMDPFNLGKRLSMDPFNMGKRLSMDPFNMGKRLSMDPFNLGKKFTIKSTVPGKRMSMDPFNLGKRHQNGHKNFRKRRSLGSYSAENPDFYPGQQIAPTHATLGKRLSMDPFNLGKRLSMDPFNLGKRLSMDPFNLGKRLSMDPFNLGKRLSMDPFNLGKRLSVDPFNIRKRTRTDPYNLIGKRRSMKPSRLERNLADPFNLGKRLSMDPFNLGKRLSMDPFNIRKRTRTDPYNLIGKRRSMKPSRLERNLAEADSLSSVAPYLEIIYVQNDAHIDDKAPTRHQRVDEFAEKGDIMPIEPDVWKMKPVRRSPTKKIYVRVDPFNIPMRSVRSGKSPSRSNSSCYVYRDTRKCQTLKRILDHMNPGGSNMLLELDRFFRQDESSDTDKVTDGERDFWLFT
ncbi:uncharacterized protein LOC106167403 [Lingula anatina]|uniref:Uncharacterized protein LOC106167403 n=1 Tax=Lingula anatina TaxID=7574 RepID=A0A1S3ITX1_LINAN|nr:uncharacterized protein LOC106167403 [Lingula anatina]|eukprot:XP_013401647.1 uncharacterized protein LOC106167403 [Lingula anatina]